jgi:putative membrane protein
MPPTRTRWVAAVAAIGLAATPAGIAWAGDGHGAHHGKRTGHGAPAPSVPPQVPNVPAPPAPEPVDAQTFVNLATQGNTFEIVSSKLALHRSDDPVVRRIAEMLIADHTTQQGQLQTVAGELRLDVPPLNLSPEQRAIVDALRRLRGDAFDAAYLNAQVTAHEQAIALFIRAAGTPANPEPLRALAIASLPILGQHLAEVRLALEHGHGAH